MFETIDILGFEKGKNEDREIFVRTATLKASKVQIFRSPIFRKYRHYILKNWKVHYYTVELKMFRNRGEMGRSFVTTGRMVMMRSIGYK